MLALTACASRTGERAEAPSVAVLPVQTPLVLAYQTDPVQPIAFEEMLDGLATRQIVLVGETHLDDNTHRLERALLEGLQRRKPGKVVLALEMFQRDVQPVLDQYLAGEIDEAAFRERARPWPNYDTGYRPLIELARTENIPVIAANLPVDLQRMFAMKGPSAAQALTAEQRRVFPREVSPPLDAYWERLGHQLRDRFHGHDPEASTQTRTYSVQNLWDNAMAEATVDALAADPERVVVLMAGAFHVEYGHGVAHQIRARKPDADIGLVTISPTHDLQSVAPQHERARADVLLYTPARARGPQNGVLAATMPGELEFHLHVPEAARTESMPLLVWLGDAGDSAIDEHRYWQVALEDEAVLVTVVPPHPETLPDLRLEGRWWWPHRTERDLSYVGVGLDRLLDLVADRFEVDPYRIVLAGRGRGATAVLWAGLATDLPATLVAWAPTDADAVASRPLPRHDPPVRRVSLVGADDALVETLELAGIDQVQAEALPSELGRHTLEDRLRTALAIAPRSWGTPATTMRLAVDSQVGLRWAELHARIAEREAGSVRVVLGEAAPDATTLVVSPEDFADGQALPLAPGPFGGTTILVLPPDLPEAQQAKWRELAARDVIKERSRFASLHVVEAGELPKLLEDLKAAGKKSLLIAPAAFVASSERMQELERIVGDARAGLDVHWLPGLGRELARTRM